MKNIKLITVSSKVELEKCYPVMKELRKDLTLSNFLSMYEKAHAENGYQVIVAKNEAGAIVGVMGLRILNDLVHGRHVYIDDLVSSEKFRSKGLGSLFLVHAESYARENDCTNLRLCTGIDNENGKRFYERNNWSIRAVVFKKKIYPHD